MQIYIDFSCLLSTELVFLVYQAEKHYVCPSQESEEILKLVANY